MRFTNEINCAGIPTNAFFPEKNSKEIHAQVLYARKVCANCLAKQECLDYALGHSVDGIWGGTTEYERRGLRRKLKITALPVLPPTGAIVTDTVL